MAQIYNSDLTKEIVKTIKASTARDKIPDQIADKVVPVIDVNPDHNRFVNIIASAAALNATSGTIYTTPADRDFYLTAACLSLIKDATATSTISAISCVINGITTNRVLRIEGLTLTATSQTVALAFEYPIKVDRNTAIVVTNAAAVANITASGSITGYIVD